MPLYQLVCIAQHYTQYTPLRSLLTSTASLVYGQGGNVRRMDSMGCKVLPKRMRVDGKWHEKADYWTMEYDGNPRTVKLLEESLSKDPRVLRWTTLRKGVTLPQITSSSSSSSSSSTSLHHSFTSQTMSSPSNDALGIKTLSQLQQELANRQSDSIDVLGTAQAKAPGSRSRAERNTVRQDQEAREVQEEL